MGSHETFSAGLITGYPHFIFSAFIENNYPSAASAGFANIAKIEKEGFIFLLNWIG